MSRTANILGALAVAISDAVDSAAQPPEAGVPAAALVHVSHCARPSIASLSAVLGLSHSATVRLADHLEDLGWLRRRAAAWDSRAVCLVLTRAGRRRAAHILAFRNAALETLLGQALTPDECAALEKLLGKILAAATARPDDLYRICRLCDFAACPDCPVAARVA